MTRITHWKSLLAALLLGAAALAATATGAAGAAGFAIGGPSSLSAGQNALFIAVVDTGGAADEQATDGIEYAWSFSDGMIATGATVVKSFRAGGAYTVTLTATDADGGVWVVSRTVAVDDGAVIEPIELPDDPALS